MKSLQSTADLTTGRAMARKRIVDWELARPEHNTEKRKPCLSLQSCRDYKRIGSPRFSDDDVDAECFGPCITKVPQSGRKKGPQTV